MEIYSHLAHLLDALPNGFPSLGDGSEIRLLNKLFTPEEAALAIHLTPHLEPVELIAARSGKPFADVRKLLKEMVRHGLIATGRFEGQLGFALLPFVVGIYENQVNTIDRQLALLVEDYFQHAFVQALGITPQFHRIIPVGESVRNTIEVHPYESVTSLLDNAQAWGVMDCICRKQKALIGEPCGHPIEVCMVFADTPDAFQGHPAIRPLTRESAYFTLELAASAGLVHSVSNNQQGIHYICNCCTCSCGILRGMASLGMANVIARSAFVNTVNSDLCDSCANCLAFCQFEALSIEISLQVNTLRCVGCGVCVPVCPSHALALERRPEDQVLPIPSDSTEWRSQRLASRGLSQE